MQSSLLILLALISITAACPGLFGMGGGGGCGCGAPPPPSPCGCGGRKKRSLADKPTAPEFFGIAAGDKDVMCNTPELKKIILEVPFVIQNLILADTFFRTCTPLLLTPRKLSIPFWRAANSTDSLLCAQRFEISARCLKSKLFQNPFVFTIRADTAYCGATKNGHNCHAFAM